MSNLSKSEIILNLAEFRQSANVLANDIFEISEQFVNLIDRLCADSQNFSHESILLINSLMQLIEKSNNNINSYGKITVSGYIPCLQAISEL